MNDYSQYRIEQELRNCGFSQESVNSIKDTTIINRNGAQHVIPATQCHLDENQTKTTVVGEEARLARQLEDQQNMFSRFKQFTDGRIMTLERGLTTAQEVIKDMQNKLLTLQSNQQAQVNAAAPVRQNQAPATEAIDRNNVAPAQVQVDKIFYCGDC
ncbi:hypothetical protein K9M74_04185 [Candidatus Woesearchaeota archaeon]|nr:hypothetical protein [Candidatus Woesearchaeota archaeon]